MTTSSIITLTFGDMAENHKGMEQIGTMVDVGQGFHVADLRDIEVSMLALGGRAELHSLSERQAINYSFPSSEEKVSSTGGQFVNPPSAHLLVIRNGVNTILDDKDGAQKMYEEQLTLDYDKKAYMYGRVVNKHARWNLCFDAESREPDYEAGKGRIVGLSQVPHLKQFAEKLTAIVGEKAQDLKVESNYYYDASKCGIGYHGDSERRKVIGIRLGTVGTPIYFQWFYKGKAMGERLTFELEPGDMYVMCEKAVGTDWKMKNIPTLRHAVGAPKYVDIK